MFRSWKLGRLYFRFIKGTPLEAQGWTADRLGALLERLGYIQILTAQSHDTRGRWSSGYKRFVEMPGGYLTKKEVIELTKGVICLN